MSGYLAAEPAPDGAQLNTDDAGTNQNHLLGNLQHTNKLWNLCMPAIK